MFMHEAVKLAELNAKNRFTEGGPFGAVIVQGDQIVGKGKNNVLRQR